MSFRKRVFSGIVLSAIGAVAAACGASTPTPECVDVQDGRLAPAPCVAPSGVPVEPTPTFVAPPTASTGGGADGIIQRMGCGSCHAIEGMPGAQGQIGPNLSRIGGKGADYIRQSIVDPNAVIAPDCPSGPCQPDVMPQNFGERLSPEELDMLVAYLESLK